MTRNRSDKFLIGIIYKLFRVHLKPFLSVICSFVFQTDSTALHSIDILQLFECVQSSRFILNFANQLQTKVWTLNIQNILHSNRLSFQGFAQSLIQLHKVFQ